MTNMVSSPASVPRISGIARTSRAMPTLFAWPGRVLMTPKLAAEFDGKDSSAHVLYVAFLGLGDQIVFGERIVVP
jgi:hypothetical protein